MSVQAPPSIDDASEGVVDSHGGCRGIPEDLPTVMLSHHPDGVLHLKADADVKRDGASVTSWSDSVRRIDATAAAKDERPTVNPADGEAAVKFDGVKNHLARREWLLQRRGPRFPGGDRQRAVVFLGNPFIRGGTRERGENHQQRAEEAHFQRMIASVSPMSTEPSSRSSVSVGRFT